MEILQGELASVVRWHPRKGAVAAIGFRSGRISFIDVSTLKTSAIEIFTHKEDRGLSEAEISGEGGQTTVSDIADMQWDQGEDHLMVAF